MANIELVIKIPEEVYKHTKEIHEVMCDSVWLAIKNGIPIPEPHGDIIDRSKIEYLKVLHDLKYGYISWSDAGKLIKNSAPAIIEANKENKE